MAVGVEGDELRQAAVWALGKAGLKCYEDVLPFIDDADENLALHAIGAFGVDTPRPVIDRLVQDLIVGDPRRAPAASEALRIIASDEVLRVLVTAANAGQPVPDWIVATLGRMPPDRVRAALQNSLLLDLIAPMLLTAQGAHWLASETIGTDIAFLLKQNPETEPLLTPENLPLSGEELAKIHPRTGTLMRSFSVPPLQSDLQPVEV